MSYRGPRAETRGVTNHTDSARQGITTLHWPLILGLGALALVRPVMNIVGLTDQIGRPLGPILVTVGISVVWIAAVALTRVARPVLTLVLAGLTYGVLSIVLSGVLSPILTGELQGPLSRPFTIIPVLAVNLLWGAVTGVIATSLQQLLPSRAG